MSVAQQFLQPMLGGAAAWTPTSATTDGGVLPHSWRYAGQAQQWQENTKVTLATGDGDSVGAITNQGSDNYDVVQATPGARFTLKLNILNGHPVWRLDGGDGLAGAFAGGAVAQPYTVFIVSQLPSAQVASGTFYMMDSDDATNRMSLWKNNSPQNFQMYAGNVISGGTPDANYNIYTVIFNGGSSKMYANGILAISGNAGTHTPDGLTLGARYNAANQWVGDISEHLIYASGLSIADLNQLGQYLANKFNLSYTDIV